MAKFVERITIVALDGPPGAAKTLFKAKSKRRKVSMWAKPLERLQRKLLTAHESFFGEALSRHNRSNRKRRDGWLRDGMQNMMRAQRKAAKKLT